MNSVTVDAKPISPSKIICVGRNYYAHIEELGNEVPNEMVLFSKPNSAISDKLIAYQEEPLHYEGELCFMVEQRRFTAIGFGLDLTKRKQQQVLKDKGLPWERAKAFDGAAVLSEFVGISNLSDDYSFELRINEETAQRGDAQQMIYKPREILTEILTFMTLNDGDIVMTGTPKGVGVVHKGDRFFASISQQNQVIIEQTWDAQ